MAWDVHLHKTDAGYLAISTRRDKGKNDRQYEVEFDYDPKLIAADNVKAAAAQLKAKRLADKRPDRQDVVDALRAELERIDP